jgi:dTDP-4-amino-4,6-dideoxygalactose transaminase
MGLFWRRGMGSIPLVNLAAQHAEIASEVAVGWQEILDRTAFVGGPKVTAFESEYADFIGTSHCLGVGNGTDAIEIALRALGVRPGDECIIPANTFIATAAERASREILSLPLFAGITPDQQECVASALRVAVR